jgi:hypothetical protein
VGTHTCVMGMWGSYIRRFWRFVNKIHLEATFFGKLLILRNDIFEIFAGTATRSLGWDCQKILEVY